MKKVFYYILILVFCSVLACTSDDAGNGLSYDAEYIQLHVVTPSLEITRAETSLLPAEEAVQHLDVMIFDSQDESKVYHERVLTTASKGVVSLRVKRNDLVANSKYYVYVIANSTHPASTFSDITRLEELRRMKQTDYNIHITGQNLIDVPSHFLMDGIAFLKGTNRPLLPTPIVLNNGNDNDETVLQVMLRRAAAKITVRLRKGDNVTFDYNEHIGYYIKNMPYSTMLLSEMPPHETQLRIPNKTTGQYFSWSEEEVLVRMYVYSHSWVGESFFENGTSLIVNIPVTYKGEEYANSYYQILLNPNSMIERNKSYEVTGIINAPGAEETSDPIELDELKYHAAEWTNVDIDINSNQSLQYLSLSHDTIRMHNVELDSTTLRFSSSSPVKTTIEECYFTDKFGIRKEYSKTGINGNPDSGIAGKIAINSPIPTNNTIRYIKMRVTNEDGISRTVYIEQYPLIYIVNQQSWYSYRSDFKSSNARATSYQYKGDRIVSVGLSSSTWNNNHKYSDDSYSRSVNSSSFWHSKVVTSYNEKTGKSTTSFYEWDKNSNSATAKTVGTCESNTNARLYHIRITATSDEYIVGRPRMDENGYTDSGSDNALLVSPSFMIASRLGSIYTTYGNLGNINDTKDSNRNGIPDRREIFNIHCENYVEVYKDKNGEAVVLDNWRLPTEAELKIIETLQGGKNDNADAIDYLLNGQYYMSASGPVKNNKADAEGNESAIRCVRDAY